MSYLFWLSNQQFRQIEPHLQTDVRGVPLADDRLVLSGIINVIKPGFARATARPKAEEELPDYLEVQCQALACEFRCQEENGL